MQPKASYASDHDAQKELKELVKTCHREGIEVVLDFPFTAQTRVSDCGGLSEVLCDGVSY